MYNYVEACTVYSCCCYTSIKKFYWELVCFKDDDVIKSTETSLGLIDKTHEDFPKCISLAGRMLVFGYFKLKDWCFIIIMAA